MKTSSMLLQLFSLLCLVPQFVQSKTVLVDGVSEWQDPSVHVGDTVIFEHKHHYNLYIFKNQNAFSHCNFTQSTLLTKPNISSYTWHPSRPGFFYFTFNNGSLKTCQDSQKLAVKVSPLPSPVSAPSSTPVSGGVVSSSPTYPWPSQPREASASPGPGPAPTNATSPVTVPNLVPSKGGGMPFIYSNPAVPLPTGEVDSATIRPLPTSGTKQVVVGLLAGQMGLFCAVILLL